MTPETANLFSQITTQFNIDDHIESLLLFYCEHNDQIKALELLKYIHDHNIILPPDVQNKIFTLSCKFSSQEFTEAFIDINQCCKDKNIVDYIINRIKFEDLDELKLIANNVSYAAQINAKRNIIYECIFDLFDNLDDYVCACRCIGDCCECDECSCDCECVCADDCENMLECHCNASELLSESIEFITEIVKIFPNICNVLSSNNTTILLLACKNNMATLANFVVDSGLMTTYHNVTDNKLYSALMYACKYQMTETILKILQWNDIRDWTGTKEGMLVDIALKQKLPEDIILKLIKVQKTKELVSHTDSDKNDSLHNAIILGYELAAIELIKSCGVYQFMFLICNCDDKNWLMLACEYNMPKLVEIIMMYDHTNIIKKHNSDAQIDISYISNKTHMSAIQYAVNNPDILKILFKFRTIAQISASDIAYVNTKLYNNENKIAQLFSHTCDECPICLENKDQCKLIQCDHSMCLTCYDKLWDEYQRKKDMLIARGDRNVNVSNPKCPLCRTVFY